MINGVKDGTEVHKYYNDCLVIMNLLGDIIKHSDQQCLTAVMGAVT